MNNKGISRIQFIITFFVALIFVYLVWIGSQYVVEKRVVLDYVDNGIAVVLAWYIARDVVYFWHRLRWAENQAYRNNRR